MELREKYFFCRKTCVEFKKSRNSKSQGIIIPHSYKEFTVTTSTSTENVGSQEFSNYKTEQIFHYSFSSTS